MGQVIEPEEHICTVWKVSENKINKLLKKKRQYKPRRKEHVPTVLMSDQQTGEAGLCSSGASLVHVINASATRLINVEAPDLWRWLRISSLRGSDSLWSTLLEIQGRIFFS
jgi:hypothetical protein